jgi:restriction system protein
VRSLLDSFLTAVLAAAAFWLGSRVGGGAGLALEAASAVLVVGRVVAALLSVRRRRSNLDELDSMSGLEFEEYVAGLLRRQGWHVEVTQGSHDLGVDLVAEKKDQRLAVQVKRQEAPVSRRAVSDAVAGCAHYDCTGAMVVTNSYFTRGALELAASTDCELIDRDALAEMLR